MTDSQNNLHELCAYTADTPQGRMALELIRAGADVNAKSGDQGFTPAEFAKASGKTQVLDVLLAHGAQEPDPKRVKSLAERFPSSASATGRVAEQRQKQEIENGPEL